MDPVIMRTRARSPLAYVTTDGRVFLRARAVVVLIGAYTLMSFRKLRAECYMRPGTREVIAWE